MKQRQVEIAVTLLAFLVLVASHVSVTKERNNLEEDVKKKDGELNQNELSLAEKDEEISSLNAQIVALKANLTEKSKENKEKTTEIAELEIKVEEFDKSLKKQYKDEAEKKAKLEAKRLAEAERKKKEQEELVLMSKAEPKQTNTGSNKLTVVATAYTASCKGCSGTTYKGTNLISNPNASIIAVDPNVIPLGSQVKITSESYPEVNGVYKADDIGGDIKGGRIDIFIPTTNKAKDFGRREVEVEVMTRG